MDGIELKNDRTGGRLARLRLSPRWLVAGILLIVMCFSLICASVLLSMRRSSWELARQSSENLASTMDADITRNVELYDLSLRAAAANMALPEINEVSPAVRHLILFDHAATAKHFGPLKVFNSAGDLLIDSTSLQPAPDRAVDRVYFQVHRISATVGLFIGRPEASDSGEMSIHLSRRISRPDGTFGGIVVGSIRLSYFHDLFRRVKVGAEDSLTLIDKDGIMVMRSPFDISVVGRDLGRDPISNGF